VKKKYEDLQVAKAKAAKLKAKKKKKWYYNMVIHIFNIVNKYCYCN
jgi:hypothetical protein